MKATNFNYESPWRPNYEARAIFVWLAFLVMTIFIAIITHMPKSPLYWMIGVNLTMMSARALPAWRLYVLQKSLKGKPLEYTLLDDLLGKLKGDNTKVWLGKGFIWEQQHTQRVYEILKRSISDTIKQNVDDLELEHNMGQKWIHGVEPNETEIFQAIAHANGMTLITGTTGSGKTRLYDLLISQCVARKECAFIIDPKGDKELKNNAKRACDFLGQGERFVFFHPAFPVESCRLDPFANYNRVTEIATRIIAILAPDGADDSFVKFAWMAADNIAQGLVMTGQRPSLVTIKRFIQNGYESIVWKSIASHFEKSVLETVEHESGKAMITRILKSLPIDDDVKKAVAMSKLYDKYKEDYGKPELDSLVAMLKHDPAHFKKLVVNLMPTLNMLTSGPLKDLLSPNYEDHEDNRPIYDTKTIIDKNKIVYIGLDSLSDKMVAEAIGSLLLGDMASAAGDRYNNATEIKTYVNVFIDEAAEVIGAPTIQLLNKGRGAKFRVYVATQTISDFEVRLGGEAQAMQCLGNMNNLICLRVIDPKTQEFVAANLPKTRVKSVTLSQSSNVGADSPLEFSSSIGERLMEEEADLIPAPLLGMLSNLEFFAKLSGGIVVKSRLPILISREEQQEMLLKKRTSKIRKKAA